ncbi:MAG: NAD-dependent epimerase/dehydratase family protein [Anaplasmataceae bacterium]|nr:NAD-dependent epimerase/dehydratase family protein [Anaplasmataceae bacterium]
MIKILIIGGNGFIGLHLVKTLTEKGYNITIYDKSHVEYSKLTMCGDVGQVNFVSGDVTDFENIKQNIYYIDYVINLAIIYNEKDKNFNKINYDLPLYISSLINRFTHIKFINFSMMHINSLETKLMTKKLQVEKLLYSTMNKNICVIKPGVVFGEHDHFLNFFATLIKFCDIMQIKFPIIKGEQYKKILYPIYAGDIAQIIATLLQGEIHFHQIIPCIGNTPVTIVDIFKEISAKINRKHVDYKEISYQSMQKFKKFWGNSLMHFIIKIFMRQKEFIIDSHHIDFLNCKEIEHYNVSHQNILPNNKMKDIFDFINKTEEF